VEETSPMMSQRVKVGVAVGALVVALALIIYQFSSQGPDISSLASGAPALDSETGELFPRFMAPREVAPWLNTDTGKRTIWPAEPCYYLPDGRIKSKPTYVIPSGIGFTDAKVCPDCGRKVVSRNPRPTSQEIEIAKKEGR